MASILFEGQNISQLIIARKPPFDTFQSIFSPFSPFSSSSSSNSLAQRSSSQLFSTQGLSDSQIVALQGGYRSLFYFILFYFILFLFLNLSKSDWTKIEMDMSKSYHLILLHQKRSRDLNNL